MTSIGVGTTFQINASGELVAMVFRAPKTGNLSRFEAYIGAASNVPDNGLRFSFQDVDLSTGLPDAGQWRLGGRILVTSTPLVRSRGAISWRR
jgi:hypothetical protein